MVSKLSSVLQNQYRGERAVLIALYPNLELYKDTKNSIAFSIPGANVYLICVRCKMLAI